MSALWTTEDEGLRHSLRSRPEKAHGAEPTKVDHRTVGAYGGSAPVWIQRAPAKLP